MISIVIPAYNEESVISKTLDNLLEVLDRQKDKREVIVVNDGSQDSTKDIVKEYIKNHPEVKLISFSRNFGHQIAVTAGIDHALGDAVVLMDADLQDPPTLILDFIDKWQQGYDVVYAIRKKRSGESFFKLITAKLFYRILRALTNIEIPLDTGDFRLMSRRVVEALKLIDERHRFVRGLVSWVGFKQIGIEYDRAERHSGDTKYTLKKMITFAIDGLTSFSDIPLRLANFLGAICAVFGLIGILIVLIMKIFTHIPLPGWSSLMIVTMFLGGVQLFVMGIIGEYLSRVYDETRKRPLYIIEEILRLDTREKEGIIIEI